MEKLGYAVAKFANDGFALLRGDRMFAKSGSRVTGELAVTNSGASIGSSGSSSSFDEDNAAHQQESTQVAVAPTADITLSSNDMRGPPEDEDPNP